MFQTNKIIGLCGSHLFNQLPMQFIQALRSEGLKHGYSIIALSCGTSTVEDTEETICDKELVNLIQHIPLSGIVILTATIQNTSILEHILHISNQKGIPAFSVDGSLEGCYNMITDNVSGFEQMVHHVVEHHGCRKINILSGTQGDPISEERISAYKKILTEHNIPIEEERIGYGNFWDRPTRKALKKFLNSSLPFPEAIVCANDSMAITACAELPKYGYNVPEDVIITGFDGIISGQYHFPVLTTCSSDFEEASAFIVQELENFLENKTFVPKDHPIKVIPQIQQSCGCKPKTIHNLSHVVSTLLENAGDAAWHNISMNELITENLHNDNLYALSKLLPAQAMLWKDHFRVACVKASMLNGCRIEDNFTNMVSILDLRSETFSDENTVFPIEDFIPGINDIDDTDILIVRLLNSGRTVYGYNVEGFRELDDRSLQRCNDFASFLSYCLNTIVHNAQQKKLADGLRKANQEIMAMSLHDTLTGLYNRRGFYQEMAEILSHEQNLGKTLYLFSIDMNRLKYINDTFGHAEGDFAITTMARAIRKTGGRQAVCARFGGDEFIVTILDPKKDAYSTTQFSQEMCHNIDEAEDVHTKPYQIEASIGMCCQTVTTDINMEAMIANADDLMYKMKHDSKKGRS